jgi:uncharacterized protein YhfT
VDDEVAKLAVIGVLGAASAAAAHRNVAIYHDGLRTSVLELESGERTRPDLAAYAYRISIGFVVAYALPFALASGILTIHMILLGTDVVGVRCRTLVAAAGGGLAWGLAVVAGVDLFVHGVARLPVATTGRELLWLPLVYSLPLLGVVAAAELHGFRGGVVAAAATLAVWAVAHAVLRAAFPASATVFGSGLVALVVVVLALAVLALRERAEDAADPAFFEENIRRARRGWPYLLPIAALIAVTASSGWIAGEPVQLALLGSNHREGAAVVAVFSAIGFLPLQGMTGLVSGVWNQDGYPDWLLGAGYVISNPVLAGAAGAGLMAVELGTLRPVARLLTTRPGITSLGNAARGALDVVPALAMLAGGVLAATAVAGPVGAFVVIGASALNDARGRPVMPLAAPVFGYVAVLVGTGVAHELGLFT